MCDSSHESRMKGWVKKNKKVKRETADSIWTCMWLFPPSVLPCRRREAGCQVGWAVQWSPFSLRLIWHSHSRITAQPHPDSCHAGLFEPHVCFMSTTGVQSMSPCSLFLTHTQKNTRTNDVNLKLNDVWFFSFFWEGGGDDRLDMIEFTGSNSSM